LSCGRDNMANTGCDVLECAYAVAPPVVAVLG